MDSFWIRSSNVGDIITPVLVSHFFGTCSWCATGPRLLMSGSLVHMAHTGDTLFGVGAFAGAVPSCPSGDLNIKCVRGPLTANLLDVDCAIYGDAGLLLPFALTPAPGGAYSLGIVPHYVDQEAASAESWPPGTRIIPTSLPVPEFVAAIKSCRSILSSSLHGIVIAEAYGIPAGRIRFRTSSDIRSMEYKHDDYYQGTGRSLPPCCRPGRLALPTGVADLTCIVNQMKTAIEEL